MNFVTKTISIKVCRRCKSQWAVDRVSLEPLDNVVFVQVTVEYCPVCAEDFSSEVNRPTYYRQGKKIQ